MGEYGTEFHCFNRGTELTVLIVKGWFMSYPLLFKPVYKEMIWGGSRLNALYGRALPFGQTGESWDVTCRPDGMGIIENGPDAGLSFEEYIKRDTANVLGRRGAEFFKTTARFPLFVKIIDANDDLSIQVHPGGDNGKNEMWYIMEAPSDGHLVIGLKNGTTKADLRKAFENGTVEGCLSTLAVKAGDMVEIPAGLVHALTKGVIVAEVQQNSNTTFRLYDYNRLGLDGAPRELHVEKSLDAIDYGMTGAVKGPVIRNKYFTAEKLVLDGQIKGQSDPDAFSIYTNVSGNCRIVSEGYEIDVPVSRSVFIPSGLGRYELFGKGMLLKSGI
jgi:mannose-6-phosphate isomerase